MRVNNQRGFTLIELVLVITVLGILAVAAMPQFIDVSTRAAQSARDGVVGAVQNGISISRANDLVQNGPPGIYPATLDAAAAGSTAGTANRFFTNVLEQGLSDGSWAKNAAGAYVYTNGAVTTTYTYTAATGTFQ